MYLGVYSALVAPLVLLIQGVRIGSVGMAHIMIKYGLGVGVVFSVLFLRLGGMPPFTGFFLKRYALSIIVGAGYFWVGVGLVVSRVLALGFYLAVVVLLVLVGVGRPQTMRGGKYGGVWFTVFFCYSLLGLPVIGALGMV